MSSGAGTTALLLGPTTACSYPGLICSCARPWVGLSSGPTDTGCRWGPWHSWLGGPVASGSVSRSGRLVVSLAASPSLLSPARTLAASTATSVIGPGKLGGGLKASAVVPDSSGGGRSLWGVSRSGRGTAVIRGGAEEGRSFFSCPELSIQQLHNVPKCGHKAPLPHERSSWAHSCACAFCSSSKGEPSFSENLASTFTDGSHT